MKINHREIGKSFKPYVIAEMSGNHNHSLDRALEIVKRAAASGVDAIKIQTYTPDTMTLDIKDREFFIQDKKNLWSGKSLYDLYAEASTPWEWHEPIFNLAIQLGITPFSSPFDASAVDFLEDLDVACYKIASFENTDLNLIRRVSSTGKPVIISTGMASISELGETVQVAREAGCKDLVLLKCTSTYPSSPVNTNLLTIPNMRELFGCEVGLSDHTLGIGVSVASVALGATVIEKHFTLSRADGGVDSTFSMEPSEMRQLVAEAGQAWEAVGGISYGPTQAEIPSIQYRRSLYVVEDIEAGESLTSSNIRAIRPGLGLPPKFFNLVIGAVAKKKVKRGTPLGWDILL